MLNGSGIGVTLFLSGCEHHCKGCQNPITWNINDGLEFDGSAMEEIFDELDNDWCNHLTVSGGDPLHHENRKEVLNLLAKVKSRYPSKKIWLYTGYTWEELDKDNVRGSVIRTILLNIDVLVDGRFIKELSDIHYKWAGSTNQRVIDAKESLKEGRVILWKSSGFENSGNEENSSSPAPCCEGL